MLDDEGQAHRIRTPFFSASDNFVTYKEHDWADNVDQELQKEMRNVLPLIMYAKPEMATLIRSITCHANYRKIYLDLESNRHYTFGKMALGKGKRRPGENLTQTDEDGVTIRYSLSYDKSDRNYGESCFRLHEITLPLTRLKKGISNCNF